MEKLIKCPNRSTPHTEATKQRISKSLSNKPKEKEIQKEILQWLTDNNIFHYRQNSGVFFIGKRMIRAGTPGVSDIVGVLNGGVAFFIEVKNWSGVLSENQRIFLKRAKEAGAITIVARSLEDVIDRFKNFCLSSQ